MKIFWLSLLVATSVMAAPSVVKKTQPINKAEAMVKKEKTKQPNTLDKKTEDCDDKAKKPVVISEESISLSGTTGCSLDDAHP